MRKSILQEKEISMNVCKRTWNTIGISIAIFTACLGGCKSQHLHYVESTISYLKGELESEQRAHAMELTAAKVIEWRLIEKPRGYEAEPAFQAFNVLYWISVFQTRMSSEELKFDDEYSSNLIRGFTSNADEIKRLLPRMRESSAFLQDKSDDEILASLGYAVLKAQKLDSDWKKREKITIGFLGCWWHPAQREVVQPSDIENLSAFILANARRPQNSVAEFAPLHLVADRSIIDSDPAVSDPFHRIESTLNSAAGSQQ